jgi:hypothetical protein
MASIALDVVTESDSITIGNNNNRLLLVLIGTHQTTTHSWVKFNGVDLTLIKRQEGSYNEHCEIWGLVNPDVGTYNLTYSTVSGWWSKRAISLYNCASSLPSVVTGSNASSNAIIDNIVSTSDWSWVVNVMSGEPVPTMYSTCDMTYKSQGASYQNAGFAMIKKRRAGTATTYWSLSYGGRWQSGSVVVAPHADNQEDTIRNIIKDDFTESSTVDLTAHTPDVGTSWDLVWQTGTTSKLQVNNAKQAISPNTVANSGVIYKANATYPQADYSIETKIIAGFTGTNRGGLLARLTDQENFYILRFTTGATVTRLYKKVSGTVTAIGSGFTADPKLYDVVRLELVGSTLKYYFNEILQATITDSAISTAGQGGLAMGGGAELVASTDDIINTSKLMELAITYPTKTYNESISESLSASDGLASAVETSGTAYNDSITESLTGSDSLSNTHSAVSTISESLTGSDSLSNTHSAVSTISESLTGTDSLSNVLGATNTISESLTISESVSNTDYILQENLEASGGTDVGEFDYAFQWGGSNAWSIDSTSKIEGTYSFRSSIVAEGAAALKKIFTSAYSEYFFKFDIFIPNDFGFDAGSVFAMLRQELDSDSSKCMVFQVDDDVSGLLLGFWSQDGGGYRSTGLTLSKGTIHTIQIAVKRNATTGYLKVWLDNDVENSPDFSSTGLNTGATALDSFMAGVTYADGSLTGYIYEDNFYISENFIHGSSEIVTESITPQDSFTTTLVLGASISESLTSGDSVGNALSAVNTISESASGADTLANVMSQLGVISESLGATDSLTAIKKYTDTISESATLTDTLGNTQEFQTSLTESVAGADTLANAMSQLGAISESLGATDSLTAIKKYTDTISESVTSADTLSNTQRFQSSLFESITGVDTLSSTLTASEIVSEALSLVDGLANVISQFESILESVTGADELEDSLTSTHVYDEAISESLVVAETVVNVMSFVNTSSEGLSLSDMLSASNSITETQAESLAVGDSLSELKLLNETVSENITGFDSFATNAELGILLEEALSLVEDLESWLDEVGSELLGVGSISFGTISNVNTLDDDDLPIQAQGLSAQIPNDSQSDDDDLNVNSISSSEKLPIKPKR